MATERRRRRREPATADEASSLPGMTVLALALAGLGCVAAGPLRLPLDLRTTLTATFCVAAGVGLVAIGLLEADWLAPAVSVADFLADGLYWFVSHAGWNSRLSEREVIGRHAAPVFYVGLGVPAVLYGCLLGLYLLRV